LKIAISGLSIDMYYEAPTVYGSVRVQTAMANGWCLKRLELLPREW
jgi:hypothetical protein